MEQKRAKKNQRITRINRLKRRRRKIRSMILLTTITLLLIISGIVIKNIYISNKCTSLEYAVDHYFTSWSNKNLRLTSVKTMALIDKSDNTATVEAYGLSYKEPRQRTTLVGIFVKNEDGSWKMKSVENKANLTSTE